MDVEEQWRQESGVWGPYREDKISSEILLTKVFFPQMLWRFAVLPLQRFSPLPVNGRGTRWKVMQSFSELEKQTNYNLQYKWSQNARNVEDTVKAKILLAYFRTELISWPTENESATILIINNHLSLRKNVNKSLVPASPMDDFAVFYGLLW